MSAQWVFSKLAYFKAWLQHGGVLPPKYGELSAVELSQGDIAIDCGANIGDVTKILCETGARVYAFEPNPSAFLVLRSRMKRKKNVFCINKGVYDENTTMKLYLHERAPEDQVHWSTGSSLLPFKNNVCKNTFVQIEVIDLCGFIDRLNQPVKLLKLDVEGVEFRILKKLVETGLVFRIEHIFAETHEDKIPQLKKEYEEIQQLIAEKNIQHINLQWI